MLKRVGRTGKITLGKRYAGRHFELEELPGGELVLRPVELSRGAGQADASVEKPSFDIAEVGEVVRFTRDGGGVKDPRSH